MTLQQICADVNRVKSWGQQAYLGSSHKISLLGKPATGNAAPHVENTKHEKHTVLIYAIVLLLAKMTLYFPSTFAPRSLQP